MILALTQASRRESMNNRETLRWLAFENHGIVTTHQAAAAGVPAVEYARSCQPRSNSSTG